MPYYVARRKRALLVHVQYFQIIELSSNQSKPKNFLSLYQDYQTLSHKKGGNPVVVTIAQLVFCESSSEMWSFTLYEELTSRLLLLRSHCSISCPTPFFNNKLAYLAMFSFQHCLIQCWNGNTDIFFVADDYRSYTELAISYSLEFQTGVRYVPWNDLRALQNLLAYSRTVDT